MARRKQVENNGRPAAKTRSVLALIGREASAAYDAAEAQERIERIATTLEAVDVGPEPLRRGVDLEARERMLSNTGFTDPRQRFERIVTDEFAALAESQPPLEAKPDLEARVRELEFRLADETAWRKQIQAATRIVDLDAQTMVDAKEAAKEATENWKSSVSRLTGLTRSWQASQDTAKQPIIAAIEAKQEQALEALQPHAEPADTLEEAMS